MQHSPKADLSGQYAEQLRRVGPPVSVTTRLPEPTTCFRNCFAASIIIVGGANDPAKKKNFSQLSSTALNLTQLTPRPASLRSASRRANSLAFTPEHVRSRPGPPRHSSRSRVQVVHARCLQNRATPSSVHSPYKQPVGARLARGGGGWPWPAAWASTAKGRPLGHQVHTSMNSKGTGFRVSKQVPTYKSPSLVCLAN